MGEVGKWAKGTGAYRGGRAVLRGAGKLPVVGTALDVGKMGLGMGKAGMGVGGGAMALGRGLLKWGGVAAVGLTTAADLYAYHQRHAAFEEALGSRSGMEAVIAQMSRTGYNLRQADEDVSGFLGQFNLSGRKVGLRRAGFTDYAKMAAYSALLSPGELIGGQDFRETLMQGLDIARPGEMEGMQKFAVGGETYYAFSDDDDSFQKVKNAVRGMGTIAPPATAGKPPWWLGGFTKEAGVAARTAAVDQEVAISHRRVSDQELARTSRDLGVDVYHSSAEVILYQDIAMSRSDHDVIKQFLVDARAGNAGAMSRMKGYLEGSPQMIKLAQTLAGTPDWKAAHWEAFEKLELLSGGKLQAPSGYAPAQDLTDIPDLPRWAQSLKGHAAAQFGQGFRRGTGAPPTKADTYHATMRKLGAPEGITAEEIVGARGFTREALARGMLQEMSLVVDPSKARRGSRGSVGEHALEQQIKKAWDPLAISRSGFRRKLSALGDEIMRMKGAEVAGKPVDDRTYRAMMKEMAMYTTKEVTRGVMSPLFEGDPQYGGMVRGTAGLRASRLHGLAELGKVAEYYKVEDRWYEQAGTIKERWKKNKMRDQLRYILPAGNIRGALEKYIDEFPAALSAGKEALTKSLSQDVLAQIDQAGASELEELSRIFASDPLLSAQFGRYTNQMLAIETGWTRRRKPKAVLERFEGMAGMAVWGDLKKWERDVMKGGGRLWTVQAKIAEELQKSYRFEGSRGEGLTKAHEIAGMMIKAMGAKTSDEQRKQARSVAAALRKFTRHPMGAGVAGEQGEVGDLGKLIAMLESSEAEKGKLIDLFKDGTAQFTMSQAGMESLGKELAAALKAGGRGGGLHISLGGAPSKDNQDAEGAGH